MLVVAAEKQYHTWQQQQQQQQEHVVYTIEGVGKQRALGSVIRTEDNRDSLVLAVL